MTLKELREYLARVPATFDDLEVKVWLPGSTISVDEMMAIGSCKNTDGKRSLLLLEGNVDPGSALGSER